jgi:hypothetical protein
MRNRFFFTLLGIFVMGSVLVSVQSFGKVNKGKNSSPSSKITQPFNYQVRQQAIHSHILHMFPGTYLDSMALVIILFNDSLRNEILKGKTDSNAYFKECLNCTLKDSVLLGKLSRVSSGKEIEKEHLSGVFTAHCMDESNSLPIDSVAIDVFSDNTLIASGLSDKLGIIQLHGISEGNYAAVISKRGFVPLSLKHIKVAITGISAVTVLLRKRNGYLMGLLIENTWLLFAGLLVLLIFTGFLAFYLGKRSIKRNANK